MNLKYLSESDKDLWDSLVERVPETGFMQSWAWSLFKEAEGQQVLRLGVFDGKTLCAGARARIAPVE